MLRFSPVLRSLPLQGESCVLTASPVMVIPIFAISYSRVLLERDCMHSCISRKDFVILLTNIQLAVVPETPIAVEVIVSDSRQSETSFQQAEMVTRREVNTLS